MNEKKKTKEPEVTVTERLMLNAYAALQFGIGMSAGWQAACTWQEKHPGKKIPRFPKNQPPQRLAGRVELKVRE